MKRGRIDRRDKASSALVITLLGVVLLTIIVVAFMQTMTLSLTTSKSYVDIRRATLAAQAGLDTAIAQISLATGTNLAFVTGLTNYTYTYNGTNYNSSITLISAGNLTNFNQVMPLVSGNISYLTNFNTNGFAANFTNYTSPLYPIPYPTNTVDVNTAYEFIQYTNVGTGINPTTYPATWVTMTNVVGSQTSYTRFAYVVLDDTARVNPTLMTGTGTGLTNSTNWYTGPQDINVTSLTNSAGAQVLTAYQMTNANNGIVSTPAYSNSFGYSDATLGEAYSSSAAYQTNEIYLTSSTNPSFDVIPAWYPNGGMPKYNINDLATNTAYGATALTRASNIASIITNNLPNFYLRDAAMNATNTTLYVNRLAANIVAYINPDGAWGASEYTTNATGVSPQVKGVFPYNITEQDYAPTGGAGTAAHTTASVAIVYWVLCWNPYTTPVPLTNVVLHVWHAPEWYLGNGNPIGATTNYIGTNNYCSETNNIAQPNEFVTLGFPPVTNTVTCTTATTAGPAEQTDATNNGGDSAPFEQYSLTINGQTAAQSQNLPAITGLLRDPSGGVSASPTNYMSSESYGYYGSQAGDIRFLNYEYSGWNSTHDEYNTVMCANGYETTGGSARWDPFPAPAGDNYWTNRDNIARPPANPGNYPTNVFPNPWTETPDQLTNDYNSNVPSSSNPTGDSNAAPCVIRNGPMVSIGELGHVFDPAYASEKLDAVPTHGEATGYEGPYTLGGGRSLRIGAPEYTGALREGGAANGSYSWDVNGERAIDLLDLFTVNNANTNTTTGTTNTIAQNMNYGGALGRINPNTASSNVLAAVFSGIRITSDPGMTNSAGALMSPLVLTNIPTLASNVIANRPYSCLSDLYTNRYMFDTTNYYWSPSAGSSSAPKGYPATNSSGFLNVFNRVHQEAFGKLVQHLTVQSRSYRVYVIGQVLDSNQNPRGSVAMQAGIYLQYNQSENQYDPVIQYLRVLK